MGVVFFGDNLTDPAQTKALLAGMQSTSPLGLFWVVDEESGLFPNLPLTPPWGW